MFCINPPTNGPKRISIPCEWERNTCRTYSFMLIGLEFSMSLGKQIPQWHRDLCFVSSARRTVIVANATEQYANDTVEKIIRRGQVKGKLAKQLPPRYRQP
jgi:hypothetical protein